jgi:catechol 2,3-dioxygenase-like lactoylglutathione lyase family enzyme
MAFHHLAIATRDMPATHAFYSQAMGFELVKVEVAETPQGGWAKHFFYDTGDGELMAFWELHDDALPSEFETGMSRAAGLPEWVNHVAFKANDMGQIDAARDRWLANGYDVLEIDHNWCYSVYATDPGGTLVEFCITTGQFSQADRDLAERAVTNDDVERSTGPANIRVHKAEVAPVHTRDSQAA